MSPPQPKRPRTLDREARRLQVIEATIATLAARGYARTTLTEVARAAGISHGLVLFHFETKERLMAETLSHLAGEYHAAWSDRMAAAGSDPRAQLMAQIETDFDPALTTPDRLAAWCAFWGEAQSRPFYQEACGALDALYIRRLEETCAALGPDPVHKARILRLVIEGTWLDLVTVDQAYDPAEARRTVMAAVALCFPGLFPA